MPLSYLIKAALEEVTRQHIGKKSADFHEHYRWQFSMVVGLSLTAMLVRGNQKQSCEKYLCAFLSFSDDFTQHMEEFDHISQLVAETVCDAISAFRFIGSPRYFDDFIQAVINVVDPLRKKSIKEKEKVEKLLKELFETCK
jgi:hypothetical protein